VKKIGEEEWEIRLPAQAEKVLHTEGEVQFSGRKGIVSHQIIRSHVKVAPDSADFSGVGSMNPRIRIKKVTGVDQENTFRFLTELFDKGCAPGQTAKQEVSSAAGLHFSMHVCRESEGKVFSRVSGRRLRPSRNGEQEDEQKHSENLAQGSLLKRDDLVQSRQNNGFNWRGIRRTPVSGERHSPLPCQAGKNWERG
jgi:hypothetical protein